MLVLSTEEMNIPAHPYCATGDRIILHCQRQAGQQPEAQFVLCGTRLFYPIYLRNCSHVILDFTSDQHDPWVVSEGRFKLRFEQIPLQ